MIPKGAAFKHTLMASAKNPSPWSNIFSFCIDFSLSDSKNLNQNAFKKAT